MRAHDVARAAQAEPRPAGVAAARSLAPEKRLERLFQFLLLDTRPVVASVYAQVARCFGFGFRFGCGIRRSNSRRSGIFSSICSEMRLHTPRQSSTMAVSAAR